MFRRLSALALLTLTVITLSGGVASAEPYPPRIPTQTTIVVHAGGPHEPITIDLKVSVNTNDTPRGRLDLKLSKLRGVALGAQAAAPADWTASVHYDGTPIVYDGPALAAGTYAIHGDFTPDDSVFLPSEDTTRFTIARGDHGGGDGGNGGNGGVLPNTGGPSVLWLAGGVLLLGAGAVTTGTARRRRVA